MAEQDAQKLNPSKRHVLDVLSRAQELFPDEYEKQGGLTASDLRYGGVTALTIGQSRTAADELYKDGYIDRVEMSPPPRRRVAYKLFDKKG